MVDPVNRFPRVQSYCCAGSKSIWLQATGVLPVKWSLNLASPPTQQRMYIYVEVDRTGMYVDIHIYIYIRI